MSFMSQDLLRTLQNSVRFIGKTVLYAFQIVYMDIDLNLIKRVKMGCNYPISWVRKNGYIISG